MREMAFSTIAVAALALAAGCGGSSGGGAGGGAAGGVPGGSDGDDSGDGSGGPVLGLDARPSNPACVAPSLDPRGDAEIELERVFANLAFDQPLGMLQAPDDASRWFVLEKGGRVRVFANDPDVSSFDTDFLSLNVDHASEGGLLGMAFHPGYASSGEVFVSFTEGPPMVSVVARFTSAAGGATLDPGSREDILRVNQDFNNHNGGHIAFGPDGYLYAGLGDGGSGGDPNNRAQDTTSLLGALLRLDIDGGAPYAIPSGPEGNPFEGQPACPADHTADWSCPELYAWGLRNPWRFSFDRESGVLWLADVGQGAREEIDIVRRGGNYGWNCREGAADYASPGPDCAAATDLEDPVHDYPHSLGQSVTGGYVYRGSAVPALFGQYVFGDFVSGRIWRLVDDGEGGYLADELARSGLAIASFAEGNDGELYVVDLNGTLQRIVAADDEGDDTPAVPERLSETGCFMSGSPSRPVPGAIPFAVAAPAWFDGAQRERWLALPDGTALTLRPDDTFDAPEGSVLIEHLWIGDRLIETRLLMHHPGGDWAGYGYEWNAEQSDALLVDGGKRADIGGQEWIFPGGGACMSCHREAAGRALGLTIAQLNRDLHYEATGRTANQLATLAGIGVLASPIANPDALPALTDPRDAEAPLGRRARSVLHASCAHCHGGAAIAGLDLRYDTPLELTGACDVPPERGDLGIAAARLIAPGDAARSVLLERMRRRDAHGMPPLATTLIDDDGVEIIGAWIDALAGCVAGEAVASR